MSITSFFDLPGAFRRHFRVLPAFTTELREACFRIRHQVYCEEFGFEPVRSSGLETDDWDANSLHCVMQAVTSEEFIGCMRLVMPRTDDPDRPLPFERVCAQSIYRELVDPKQLPRDSIAEVSRLAVVPSARRIAPAADAAAIEAADHAFALPNSAVAACVQVGLYLGMLVMAHLHRIDTVFMLCEPRLARQLGMLMGVRPEIIGSAVEHRGSRVPAMISIPRLLDHSKFSGRPLFDEIRTRVLASYNYGAHGEEQLAEAA